MSAKSFDPVKVLAKSPTESATAIAMPPIPNLLKNVFLNPGPLLLGPLPPPDSKLLTAVLINLGPKIRARPPANPDTILDASICLPNIVQVASSPVILSIIGSTHLSRYLTPSRAPKAGINNLPAPIPSKAPIPRPPAVPPSIFLNPSNKPPNPAPATNPPLNDFGVGLFLSLILLLRASLFSSSSSPAFL